MAFPYKPTAVYISLPWQKFCWENTLCRTFTGTVFTVAVTSAIRFPLRQLFMVQATAFFALDRRNSLAYLPLLRLTTLPYKLFSGIVFSDTIYQRQKPDRSRAFVVIPQNLCSPLLLPQKIARKGRKVTSASDNVAARTVHKNATVCKKTALAQASAFIRSIFVFSFPLVRFLPLAPSVCFPACR